MRERKELNGKIRQYEKEMNEKTAKWENEIRLRDVIIEKAESKIVQMSEKSKELEREIEVNKNVNVIHNGQNGEEIRMEDNNNDNNSNNHGINHNNTTTNNNSGNNINNNSSNNNNSENNNNNTYTHENSDNKNSTIIKNIAENNNDINDNDPFENDINNNDPSLVGYEYWQNVRRNTESSSTIPCITSVSSLSNRTSDDSDQPDDEKECRMGNKLVECEERILTLQSDNEFLRTKNTQLKNENKVRSAIPMPLGEQSSDDRGRDSPSTSTNCCCCDTTVEGITSLKRDVARILESLNTFTTSQEKRVTSTPSSSSSSVAPTTSSDTTGDNADTPSSEVDTDEPSNNTYTVQSRGGVAQTGHGDESSSLTRHKKVVILSDSMCGGMDNHRLNRALENKTTYKKVFPGGTPEDVNFYSTRTLTIDKPDISIIHTGTNRIGKSDPFEIARGIMKNVQTCKDHGCDRVLVSGVIGRPDHSEQVEQLNNILQQWQYLHGYTFIYNDNIKEDCLAYDNHHLNKKGKLRLAANFRRILSKPWI